MKIALLNAWAPGVPLIYKLIDLCSGCAGYGHAELWFADGTGLSSHTGQGVAIEPPAYPRQCWTVFDVHHEQDEEAVKAWGRRLEGPCYDYLGVIEFLPGIRAIFHWLSPLIRRHWFCSKVVDAACERLGLFRGVAPAKVSPNVLWGLCAASGLPEE